VAGFFLEVVSWADTHKTGASNSSVIVSFFTEILLMSTKRKFKANYL